MAKTKKPRKRYQGTDAAVTPPVIRVKAEQRNRRQQWWLDHKTDVILRSVQLGFVLILLGLVVLVWSLLN